MATLKEQSKGTHTERLTIRVSPQFLEKIRESARAKQMSISTFVRDAILNHIQAYEFAEKMRYIDTKKK